MKIDSFLQKFADTQLKATQWYRTAPIAERPTLVIKILGIEMRKSSSVLGGESVVPCLVVNATCGEETRRFCWALTFGPTVEVPHA